MKPLLAAVLYLAAPQHQCKQANINLSAGQLSEKVHCCAAACKESVKITK